MLNEKIQLILRKVIICLVNLNIRSVDKKHKKYYHNYYNVQVQPKNVLLQFYKQSKMLDFDQFYIHVITLAMNNLLKR